MQTCDVSYVYLDSVVEWLTSVRGVFKASTNQIRKTNKQYFLVNISWWSVNNSKWNIAYTYVRNNVNIFFKQTSPKIVEWSVMFTS